MAVSRSIKWYMISRMCCPIIEAFFGSNIYMHAPLYIIIKPAGSIGFVIVIIVIVTKLLLLLWKREKTIAPLRWPQHEWRLVATKWRDLQRNHVVIPLTWTFIRTFGQLFAGRERIWRKVKYRIRKVAMYSWWFLAHKVTLATTSRVIGY